MRQIMTRLETPSGIGPCMLDEYPAALGDVISDVVALAAELGTTLHPVTAGSLADLVRVMNCYYSNLIEGHNTRPREIERALVGDFDGDAKRRDLQLEARAHIRVQHELDHLHAAGQLGEPAAVECIRWLHRLSTPTRRRPCFGLRTPAGTSR
jgi:Fic family protein